MPKWLDNAIFYEIYPQTFLDTNGDGIGDFQGIIRKLDYIKELGCNAIWLNPCFVSPFSDAGYDVADYYTAAPRYGTNEDLKVITLDSSDTFTNDEEMVNVCIATRKDDTELRDKIQGAMDAMGWNDSAEMDKLMEETIPLQPAASV